jgi:hypothetical protein
MGSTQGNHFNAAQIVLLPWEAEDQGGAQRRKHCSTDLHKDLLKFELDFEELSENKEGPEALEYRPWFGVGVQLPSQPCEEAAPA